MSPEGASIEDPRQYPGANKRRTAPAKQGLTPSPPAACSRRIRSPAAVAGASAHFLEKLLKQWLKQLRCTNGFGGFDECVGCPNGIISLGCVGGAAISPEAVPRSPGGRDGPFGLSAAATPGAEASPRVEMSRLVHARRTSSFSEARPAALAVFQSQILAASTTGATIGLDSDGSA